MEISDRSTDGDSGCLACVRYLNCRTKAGVDDSLFFVLTLELNGVALGFVQVIRPQPPRQRVISIQTHFLQCGRHDGVLSHHHRERMRRKNCSVEHCASSPYRDTRLARLEHDDFAIAKLRPLLLHRLVKNLLMVPPGPQCTEVSVLVRDAVVVFEVVSLVEAPLCLCVDESQCS